MKPVDRDPLNRLDEALELLPRGIEPARDLWPAIEANLEPRPARATRRWPWLAAAGVLLVLGSSLITASLLRREAPVVAQAPLERPGVALTQAAFGPGQTLDPSYDVIRRQLAESIAARIERLPPEARAKLEANLAELHRATTEINAALELSPGDPLLEELLINSYQDELAVLASVHQLTGPNGSTATNDEVSTRIPL
jgi:hypothetical protein